jgi:hypothetical protein
MMGMDEDKINYPVKNKKRRGEPRLLKTSRKNQNDVSVKPKLP